MNIDIERNLGEQPIAKIMADYNLKSHDIVSNSTEQLTHKMIARACKGRRLTPNIKLKIKDALNKSLNKKYSIKELFTY
jgi:hypothetical protein